MDPETPKTRVRIEHSRTIKDGWSYSTTVETTFADGTPEQTTAAMAHLRELLAQARVIGETERDDRNYSDEARRRE